MSSDELEDIATSPEGQNQSEGEQCNGDLNDDLQNALSQDFDFTGSYYHRSVEPNAPNPGLTIEGVGLIGLPLSERDAKVIISHAAQAPFGKGEHTVIDTEVRDTWEIEPRNVSFINPSWNAFVETVATKKVWTTLGVAPYTTKPKCELYKLLLYQRGSHFLPHQDTVKSNGMFATIVIVLPSAFEGGEVHISHAGQSTILDVSQGSIFNTSVLAWYTDVIHEVKPIKSGYRLALSYNLIHTSPNSPQPSLPDTPHGAFDPLREVLQRWKEDEYGDGETPDLPLYAYMLAHQYSQDDLNRGLEGLKGKDAHLVSHILQIVEELDFALCIANLNKTEMGTGDDEGGHYYKRGRGFGGYNVGMGELEDETIELSNVVRVSSQGVLDLGLKTFQINEESLVPRNAFENMRPDGQEYEGYQGNGAGGFSQWYHRSGLVLFRKSDEISIIMSVSGPSAVLNSLPLTATPSKTAEEVVSTILQDLKDSTIAVAILKHAVLWKRHDIWIKAIRFVNPLDKIDDAVTEGLKVFGLKRIKPGLESLVRNQSGLKARLDATKAIEANIPGRTNTAWIQGLTKDALATYSAASVADIPALLQLAEELKGGIETLATIVVPKTSAKANTYDFHIALTEALDIRRKELQQGSDGTSPVPIIEAFSNITRQCLLAAASQWATPPPPPPATAHYHIRAAHDPTLSPTVLAERINTLIKICFSTDNPDLCIQIAKKAGVGRQLDALTAIKSHVGASTPAWVKEIMRTVVQVYSAPALSHIPTLSWIAQELGPRHIRALVETKVPTSRTYEFLMSLAKSLHERLSLISRVKNTPENIKVEFRAAINRCVVSAIPQWEAGVYIQQYTVHRSHWRSRKPLITSAAGGPNDKVKRILELVEFCFTTGDLNPCSTLFNNLLQIEQKVNVIERYKEIHRPLVPLLKAAVAKHGKTFMQEPFKSFFKGIISIYLGRILATVPLAPSPALPARRVGCGCADCERLAHWLETGTPTFELRAVQASRTHLEKHITSANIGNLVTYDTNKRGTPYTLVVSKRPEIMSGLRWREARRLALSFVKMVGDNDDNLKVLMQERYDDMNKSFSGTKTFVVGQLRVATSSTTSGTGPGAASEASGSNTTVPPPVAGGKRKHRNPPTNVIDVLDLT